jgi:hypothetical protein
MKKGIPALYQKVYKMSVFLVIPLNKYRPAELKKRSRTISHCFGIFLMHYKKTKEPTCGIYY